MASAFDPQVAESLHRRLSGFRPDAQRQWGRMTAHQAVVHMTDTFRMALGERPIPSAELLTASVAYDIAPGWRVALRGSNLASSAATRASYSSPKTRSWSRSDTGSTIG